ncbi:MAG: hypothetical protein LBP22_03400 [Deltaproteobacteria bacterium]|jgi:hypothetical protein|nr:hypothetical protein [Deltaproteobacteria bacterium]
MTILMKDLDPIREELNRRTLKDVPGYADQKVSTRKAIQELAPILLEKKESGFKTADLVAMLKDLQIITKGPTLTRYLKEFQEEIRKEPTVPPKSKPADAAPKKTKTPSAPKKPRADAATTDEAPTSADQKSDNVVTTGNPPSGTDNVPTRN